MDYFAGLDISMDDTHVCVLDREGMVVRESKTESTAEAIAGELAKAPSCRRIVFETGRMTRKSPMISNCFSTKRASPETADGGSVCAAYAQIGPLEAPHDMLGWRKSLPLKFY
jgi:hypothetical protein